MVRLSDKDDNIRFYETMINYKSVSLDRTSDQEINDFNKLVEKYKNTMFNQVTNLPTNKKGEILDIVDIMNKKKDLLAKPLNIKLDKKASSDEEFIMMDIKNLVKGKN